MGLAYVFALVVALGILLVQIAMGGKSGDGHDADGGHEAGEAEAELEAGDHADHADHGEHAGGGKDLKHAEAESGFFGLFLSTRFWIFASLAFGMSGSLIHYLSLAGPVATFLIALGAGLSSGLFTVLLFQVVKKTSVSTTTQTSDAVGRVGRVLIPCGPGRMGKVRIELKGHSVDMLATTEEGEIKRGEMILVEDVDEHTVRVSRRPPELE
jgi:membrane protein implicated in regulation of membrane protease activity